MPTNKKELRDAQEGPTVDELKERFKSGSIPLQTDFANLIDVAEHGRRAVGKSKGQTGPANGFTLSPMGRLELKLNAKGGLKVDADGISIKAGKGMTINDSGMMEPNISSYPFGDVEIGKDYCPVKVNSTTNGLVIDLNVGLVNTSYGLSVDLGDGLQADRTNGISLIPEQTLQKGMIMMFAGTEAEMPKGWALCDGTQGTPNLIDRFIIGGKSDEVGKTGGQGLTGSGSNKAYTVKTNAVSAGEIALNISGTTLEEKHIPPHAHDVRHTWNTGNVAGGITSLTVGNQQGPERRKLIDAYGNNAEAHTHTGTATQGEHSHTVDKLPAYYILAFIMKL